jgi:hypothetical protein
MMFRNTILADRIKQMNQIEIGVDRLFSAISGERGDLCLNPVTGGWFVLKEDSISAQIKMAYRALLAREWFAKHGPADAPPLLLSSGDIEDLKYGRGALQGIVSRFAYSLRSLKWDFARHPGFEAFARGVLASKKAPQFILEDKALRLRYPPRPLAGLGPYLVWETPERHAPDNGGVQTHSGSLCRHSLRNAEGSGIAPCRS